MKSWIGSCAGSWMKTWVRHGTRHGSGHESDYGLGHGSGHGSTWFKMGMFRPDCIVSVVRICGLFPSLVQQPISLCISVRHFLFNLTDNFQFN
ncbi:hypothetical protein QVD17_24016 [Tagetes erecta]|uniref:Uncharacterized protein n=1 Tax=Tagetes erecta TaxID=13708 RepID=A0AAD8KF13_TARER|nr:hypothetical protein QVD17_24016 [Tagetes erecta]